MGVRRAKSGDGGGLGGFLRSLLSGIPWSERAEGEETLLFPAPPGGGLRIDNANGRTRVIGEDRRDVEVRIAKSARAESEAQAEQLVEEIRVLAREDGSGELDLEVDIPGRWNRRGRADLDVRVPRELRIQVSASNGRLCIEGLRGAVRARSANGAVRVVDVIGDVEIHTSNAKVHTQCTCGRLRARSSNGKIELEEHRGSVDAATSNGTICCALADMGKEGVVLATSNGRIALDLPETADGDVDIRVDNGVIRTSRELEPQSRERSGRLKGTLGRGGVPIRLRASNGTITLR
jgi:DUF4097 and DUF4098 domain-containing protein YvlB